MKNIVIVAGDKSGDLYGGMLCRELKEQFSGVEIHSFGGSQLAQYSRQVIDLLSHSVSGITEVASLLIKLLDIFTKTVRFIETIKPDMIILIDFPDFNLRLAKKINKRWPVFYYVSPQIWAWREKRIEIIRSYIEKMIVIFEFEKEYYHTRGIDAMYFGHPLLEIIPERYVPAQKIISFLPGSRNNEVKRHLPIQRETKKLMEKRLNGYEFRIMRADNIADALCKKLAPGIPVTNHSYEALQESEFIIASSGTATVEIAILEVPYLIMYKVNPLSWQIITKLVRTKYAGMVNILSPEPIVEELLQHQATPAHIAQRALYYLTNKNKYKRMKELLHEVKKKLAPRGATRSLAQYLGSILALKKNN